MWKKSEALSLNYKYEHEIDRYRQFVYELYKVTKLARTINTFSLSSVAEGYVRALSYPFVELIPSPLCCNSQSERKH